MMGGCFWQDNETFVDDGIQIEPFNLSKEREEGYFDAAGNYVEYINENDIKVGTVVYPKVSCLRWTCCHFHMDSCRMHGLTMLMLVQNLLESLQQQIMKTKLLTFHLEILER